MPVDKIAFPVIFVERTDDETRKHTKVVSTHACHQKIAPYIKDDLKIDKQYINKVWFGPMPVDKIVFAVFIEETKVLFGPMPVDKIMAFM